MSLSSLLTSYTAIVFKFETMFLQNLQMILAMILQ